MFQLPFPVWLLAFAQALGMCTAPLVIFVGGIIGVKLAPLESLATLPVAALVVGSAVASMPAALLMQRIGRRMGFLGATLLALLGCILAFSSISSQNFWGLCFSIALLGMHIAFVAQFRFAALEWVGPEQAAQAASVVLLGGLVAAYLGPEIGFIGQTLLNEPFAGSFVLLAGVHSVLLLLLWFMPYANMQQAESHTSGRPIAELLKLPSLGAAIAAGAIAYGVMSLIMTATPVSMTELQNFEIAESKTVIQSHILAMFIPSLFSPFLFKMLGIRYMMIIGILAFVVAITVALSGQGYWYYWIALVFLGLGWNFLFVSGTGLLAQSYTSEESFKVQAANEGVIFSVQAIMSLLSGWLVFTYGWNSLNVLAICLLLVAIIMVARWLRTVPAQS